MEHVMNNQQEQFQRTHTTNIKTLDEIVQKAMGDHSEQMTRKTGSPPPTVNRSLPVRALKSA
jgi:hypothetical protein